MLAAQDVVTRAAQLRKTAILCDCRAIELLGRTTVYCGGVLLHDSIGGEALGGLFFYFKGSRHAR